MSLSYLVDKQQYNFNIMSDIKEETSLEGVMLNKTTIRLIINY
jgi:hypothetical protein